MAKAKRIPITAAKEIAEKFDKDQVLIFAWDRKNNNYWVTTYGKTKADCRQAAQGGDKVSELLGWTNTDKENAPGEDKSAE